MADRKVCKHTQGGRNCKDGIIQKLQIRLPFRKTIFDDHAMRASVFEMDTFALCQRYVLSAKQYCLSPAQCDLLSSHTKLDHFVTASQIATLKL
ncbi:hypothetical protein AC249_AIPGENE29206 [Exaiptasia diaphana]|nr:hypothetical protein AC249_AIPGENE29206 [Exaiptasia diaphana]